MDNKPLDLEGAKKLKEICKSVEEQLKKEFNLPDKPGVGICFTFPPDYDYCHYITNLPREGGIKLFTDTAAKMIAQTN